MLVAAIVSGDGASTAWRSLYETIDQLVTKASDVRYTLASRAYLRSFLDENRDLASR
jgi:hypothetical protein